MKDISEAKRRRLDMFEKVDIYPVISSEFCAGRSSVDVMKAIADAGAKIVQLREKSLARGELYKIALEFKKISSAYGMLLIINDNMDVALAADADGVHLGQDDLPLQAALKLSEDIILGNSTHSLEEALEAQENGADYINIGPIYPTRTKAVACPALGIDTITEIKPYLKIPFTVMGGIKERHLADLIKAGARHIAMVTEITQAADIKARTQELRAYFR